MFQFLKPAKFIPRLPQEKIDATYKRYRLGVFVSIFLAYSGYYISRQAFVVASPYLIRNYGFTTTKIGMVGTALAISYGLSKFIMGSLADKCNAQYYIATGLFVSAIINLFLGATSNVYAMMFIMVIMGVFQAMGAPACHKILANWFSLKERGTKMSIWNCSHNVGAGSITPIVALGFGILGFSHWKLVFYFPSIFSIILAVIVLICGADTPQSVGLPPIDEYKGDYDEEELKKHKKEYSTKFSSKEVIVKYILKNKYMWYLALANVFVYLIRYGIVNWIPTYLTIGKGFSAAQGRISFSLFEYGAIPGVMIIGWLSDKVFKGKRAPMGIFCMVGMMIFILLYWKSSSLIAIDICIAVIGTLVYGPQMLLALTAIDIVPKNAVGSADGFIGLFGYICGDVSANLLIGSLVHKLGWNSQFYVIFAATILGLIFFMLLMNAKKVEEE